MNFTLMVVPLLFSILFSPIVERAFVFVQNRDWNRAAATLDQASTDDPSSFSANNLHYLRGIVAENLGDWPRASSEFATVETNSPLRPLALWHGARAAIRLSDTESASRLIRQLPVNFPADMKFQLARESGDGFGITIYDSLSTRQARAESARIRNDNAACWSLIRERKDDDPGLQCAHQVAPRASTWRELMDLAETFVAHRQFHLALPLYAEAARNVEFTAEARYQTARIHFFREEYRTALSIYESITRDFPNTDWAMNADYQRASCYWRLGDYGDAEKVYLAYRERYGTRANQDGAIRNLIDVYRAKGEYSTALTWVDRGLARQLSVSNRQVLLFTKAKILYSMGRYTAALPLFRQLGQQTIRSAPGSTTKEEVRYLEALTLSKNGSPANARTIWRELAEGPPSYYAVKAAEKLGEQSLTGGEAFCRATNDAALVSAQSRLISARRPIRTEAGAASSDLVAELMFLHLWEEASIWNDRGNRPDPRRSAELAYAAGRYHRSILYADRLPKTETSTLGLLYPAGFRQLVCSGADRYRIDPLWLHAIIWQESKYDPNARSGASARGLMQFIPETAHAVGAEIGLSELSLDRLYEPEVNVSMGAHYWSSLLDEVERPEMALAAYNGGLTNVKRWMAKWSEGDGELFVADIGFAETKRYVMAVFGARAAYGRLN